MTILSLQELNTMHLPVDLSGYDPNTLSQSLRQAEAWVNGEARWASGFEAHRVIDRKYGTGTNVIFSTYYPVCVLNAISIVFPPNTGQNVNLPGPNIVPIDPNRVVIDHDTGQMVNWSPFIFQTLGYMTVFPEGVPINLDYYTGYVSTVTSSAIQAAVTLIPVANASCFFYGQTIRFYEPTTPEYLNVQATTTYGGVQYVITQQPTLYAHNAQVSIGDMPPEIRTAVAYVVCDFALRELNPENLRRITFDKVTKEYQADLPVRSKEPTVGGPLIELERPMIKEARRLLEHYYQDRGVR